MFFNRVNAANKLKQEMLKDESTELTNEQKMEMFQKSIMKAAKDQQQKNMHAKVRYVFVCSTSSHDRIVVVIQYYYSISKSNNMCAAEP